MYLDPLMVSSPVVGRWIYAAAVAATLFVATCHAQQQQDPSTMNGGSLLAMAGRDCVALAVDKRFGAGPALVHVAPRHVLVPSPTSMVGLVGLEGDVQSLQQELSAILATRYQRGLGFDVGENDVSNAFPGQSSMTPQSMAMLTSHVLYNRKHAPYYVEPLVVGLQKTVKAVHAGTDVPETVRGRDASSILGDANAATSIESTCSYQPYLCSLDMIGAQSTSASFCCAGAAQQSLYGTAEALWRPNLDGRELVNVCGRAFLAALERDCLSGYGAVVYLMTAEHGIVEYDLQSRND